MDTTRCRAAARNALFTLVNVSEYFIALEAFDTANASRNGPFCSHSEDLAEEMMLAVSFSSSSSSSSSDALRIIPCIVRLIILFLFAAHDEALSSMDCRYANVIVLNSQTLVLPVPRSLVGTTPSSDVAGLPVARLTQEVLCIASHNRWAPGTMLQVALDAILFDSTQVGDSVKNLASALDSHLRTCIDARNHVCLYPHL